MAKGTGKINTFLFLKLPSAWWCGVRLRAIDGVSAMVTVPDTWFTRNPFRSMFWAVQGMAAELSTGALVMERIGKSGQSVSMLVASNKAVFHKKATGRIRFTCNEGERIDRSLQEALETGEGRTFWLRSTGVDSQGQTVSTFDFEWTVKPRAAKR